MTDLGVHGVGFRGPASPDRPLFAALPRRAPVPPMLPDWVTGKDGAALDATVDERTLDVYARAADPTDPFELRDLFLGRVEAELGVLDGTAAAWRRSRVRREVAAQEVLSSRSTVRFVKELFNSFFRDDLYGRLRDERHVIVSSGSPDEVTYPMPATLKACLEYALQRDWYGYSDSRGRRPTREAVAALENELIEGDPYDVDNISLTLGGTFGISALVDFLLARSAATGPALCATPNYPPLVESVARRAPVTLVPLACGEGRTSLEPLIAALRPTTPLVLLQTVTNPTGTAVDEAELARLIATASSSTMIVLDEAHECSGPCVLRSAARARSNVVRVVSLSKTLSVPGVKLGWLVADDALVREYYEYASTTYGGPPSLFYLLVEVMARLERWMLGGVAEPTATHLAEFEPGYALGMAELNAAYASYVDDRCRREHRVARAREATLSAMVASGVDVVRASHSVNIAVRAPAIDDGYRWFRQLLAAEEVAVFPGVLVFCWRDGWVRVTTARKDDEIDEAVRRIRRFS